MRFQCADDLLSPRSSQRSCAGHEPVAQLADVGIAARRRPRSPHRARCLTHRKAVVPLPAGLEPVDLDVHPSEPTRETPSPFRAGRRGASPRRARAPTAPRSVAARAHRRGVAATAPGASTAPRFADGGRRSHAESEWIAIEGRRGADGEVQRKAAERRRRGEPARAEQHPVSRRSTSRPRSIASSAS